MLRRTLAALLLLTAPALAAPRDVPYPFILWTRDDAAAIRKRLDTDPAAKAQLAREYPPVADYEAQPPIKNLFRIQILGDAKAAEVEKATLLNFINTPTLEKDTWDWQWHHVDIHQHALRYDALYDQLTAAQRKSLEDTFRRFARFGIEEEPLRGFGGYGRHMGEHFAALALKDQRLIKAIFASKGGMKDFLDGLMDGHFSRDSINTNHLLGQILLWCQACQRLGLNDLGYGYTSPTGGSLRKFLEASFLTALPRIDLPGHAPYYGKLTPGRLKGYLDAPPAFAADLLPLPIAGYLKDPAAPAAAWVPASHAQYYSNDRAVSRMNLALALELAYRQFPDAHFDYFLAQLRGPGQDKYFPSLYWNLDPIDPAKASPPPSPSGLYPQRQLVILHAEESPDFFNSPAPAVAFTIAGGYAGWVGDAFSLSSFVAFNRPLYHNPRSSDIWRTHWTPSGRSNSTVVVDNLQFDRRIENARWVRYSRWPQPATDITTRQAFGPLVKFAAFRNIAKEIDITDHQGKPAKQVVGVYPGVDMERAVFLTREYLLDVFRLASDKPRNYHWIAHPLGTPTPDTPDAWKPADDLDKQLGDPDQDNPTFRFADARSFDPGANTWSLTALQSAPAGKSRFDPAWYARKIGVRITLLGEPGTKAYYAHPVETKPADENRPAKKKDEDPDEPAGTPLGASEPAGFSLIAARLATPRTIFVAVHEPFENATPRLDTIRRIAQTDQALAIAITGKPGSPVNDRLLLRLGDHPDQPVTLTDPATGESFTFAGQAYLRLAPDKIEATGHLTAFKLKASGTPKLLLNAKETPTTSSSGFMTFGN